LIVALATLVGVGVTASLGQWQLNRAATKQALHDTIKARGRLPALDNTALPCTPEAWSAQAQRPVALRGHWLNERTVWLDNRAMGGRAGLFMLTPLRLSVPAGQGVDCAATVLVQRGWVPRDPYDRLRVAPPPPGAGRSAAQGVAGAGALQVDGVGSPRIGAGGRCASKCRFGRAGRAMG